jgi:hypothetical protein
MSCVKHENGTTAVEVERQLINDLNQWELQQKQLICCVTDTAANMNAFGTSISSWQQCPFVKHHYCADHLLQLTAVKCYSGTIDEILCNHGDDDDGTISSLKKARALVSYFHSSTTATEKLAAAQRTINPNGIVLKLLSDVKTC